MFSEYPLLWHSKYTVINVLCKSRGTAKKREGTTNKWSIIIIMYSFCCLSMNFSYMKIVHAKGNTSQLIILGFFFFFTWEILRFELWTHYSLWCHHCTIHHRLLFPYLWLYNLLKIDCFIIGVCFFIGATSYKSWMIKWICGGVDIAISKICWFDLIYTIFSCILCS